MEYIDLIALLKYFNKKGIEKSILYGKITRVMEKPNNLNIDLSNNTGIFVEMSVFAVNLRYYESLLRDKGISNSDNIYMVNGNVIAYVEPMNVTGSDWYSIEGTIRFGSKDGVVNNYVCVFNFCKPNGKWDLKPCRVSDLDISDWSRHSLHYSWMNESGRVGKVMHPTPVLKLPRFNSFIETVTPIANNTEVLEEFNPPVQTAKDSFVKENRRDIKNYNEWHDKFQDKLTDSKTFRDSFIKSLYSDYSSESDIDEYLRYMVDGLKKYLKHKLSSFSLTGRAVLKKYLDNFKEANNMYTGTTASNFVIDIFDEVSEYIFDHRAVLTLDGKAWELCKTAFGNEERFYCGVFGVVLGIPQDEMLSVYEVCQDNNLSVIKILNTNPYILQFISSLNYDDIERIALSLNLHNDKSLNKYRNVAMLNAYITETGDGSTVFTRTQIANADIGVRLTKSKFEKMKELGTYLTNSQQDNIECFIKHVNPRDLSYSSVGFKKSGFYYIRKITGQETVDAINDYVETGLGVALDSYVTSSSLLNKELYVFDEMFRLGSTKYDYDHTEIDKYIAEYESIVGFKLEERQREAVHLSTSAGFIVAGSAGSGKTTVSNCIVYVLTKLEPNLELKFVAPTGKAAKRLQEVVHKNVKTVHSEFKIGMPNDSIFAHEEDDENGKIAYFCDESGMLTIDLIYKMLKKIDTETCRLFLFGDFNQLPPIGKGLPFKNLLRFMPCVFLNVSKRAADGSKITANSNYVNEYSDVGNWHNLESGDDFFIMPCKSEQIPRVVYDLCAHYIDGKDVSYMSDYLKVRELPGVDDLTPDDIQVVTPIAKESYKWGASSLNKALEPLFNKNNNARDAFVYQLTQTIDGTRFLKQDRVIHIDKNMYSMQWYSTYEDGRFQKIYGQGICNGEVGKIVDFVLADDCDIFDEVENIPEGFKYTDNLRDDVTWHGDEKWFIVVEYYDYLSDRNFYILYRAEVNTQVSSNRGIIFKGEDLAKLNLFYAGTTHKLQGSQAKLVICVLDDVNYKQFITRQMVYTMFTRGSDLVYVVGSVGNEKTSMLSRARLDIASVTTKTVGELII